MNNKFRQLIDRVYEKTDEGVLEWREAAADDAFEVDLGNRTLMVFRGQTPHENLSYIGVTLFDELGRIVESETFPENTDFSSTRAENLYRLARSKARGSERTLDELLRELG
ncbi:MAG TPA: hypothetical protein VF170_03745 [Planctomycetaceae bacterium]